MKKRNENNTDINEEKLDPRLKGCFSDPEADKVPDSLKPENIGPLLEKNKKVIKFPVARFAAAAAAIVLVVAGAILVPRAVSGGRPALEDTSSGAAIAPAAASTASDYSAVEKLFENAAAKGGGLRYTLYGYDGMVTKEAATNETTSVPASADTQSDDYSVTNTQVAGVDEADILKTDGKYIYFVTNKYSFTYGSGCAGQVNIALANGGQLEKLWAYTNPDWQISDLFLSDGRLVLLMYEHPTYYSYFYSDYGAQSATRVEIFNVSDPANPTLERTFEQEGSYNTARLTDGKLLLISTKHPYYYDICKYNDNGEPVVEFDAQTVIPKTCDSAVSADSAIIPADRCIVFPDAADTSFTVVSLLDVSQPASAADTLTVMGGYGVVYANTENVYITSPGCDYEPVTYTSQGKTYTDQWGRFLGDYTGITKISMAGGKLTAVASAKVNGTLCSQFAMDEYDGYLRVATNSSESGSEDNYDWQQTNNFYVLDASMQLIGKLEGLAPNENMYSVRFDGTTVYAVTYRQVDPFFVIDLSDPTNPVVKGELKIPGFSQYLQVYGDGLVIGFGMDASDTSSGATLTRGFKVAMFDVTDPSNPKELSTLYIGDRGTYSELSDDHKALMFDREKNLIGFPITICKVADGSDEYSYGETVFDGYIILGYNSETGFTEKGRISHGDTSSEGYRQTNGITRACYIGKTVYTLSDSILAATDLSDFKEISRLTCQLAMPTKDGSAVSEDTTTASAATSSKLY